MAQGGAFVIRLVLLLIPALVLPGVIIRASLPPETAVAIPLANPLQVLRTASMMLCSPQLVLPAPTASLILDHSGNGDIAYALAYPVLPGTICAGRGYWLFRRSDPPWERSIAAASRSHSGS